LTPSLGWYFKEGIVRVSYLFAYQEDDFIGARNDVRALIAD